MRKKLRNEILALAAIDLIKKIMIGSALIVGTAAALITIYL